MAGILVPLDVLQDTRLGVLSVHKPEMAKHLIDNQELWHGRISDCVPGIDVGLFDTLYKKRGDMAEEVLGNSPVTAIPMIINKYVRTHMLSSDTQFYGSRLKIHINVWPYNFTTEVKDTLVRTVFNWVNSGHIVDISAVSISPAELTPKYILEAGYDSCYIYDLKEWIEAQGQRLLKLVIPTITIITPKLIRDPESISKVNPKYKDSDLFDTVSKHLTGVVGIEFVDVSYFSFIPVPTESDMAAAEAIELAMKEEEANDDNATAA